MTGARRHSAEPGPALLRRLCGSSADAFTKDEVARATLATFLELPDVSRVGIALTSAGGRELQFTSTDEDALTPSRVQWCLIDAYADVPLVDAARSGRDVYVGTIDDLDGSYPGVAARQRGLGTHSLVALSLATDTQHVGGLLLSFAREQPFDVEQRWLLSALAAQVTQAFRRALSHPTRQTNAEQLQRSLMPRSLPDLPGLTLGSHYLPGGASSDVGGDWYDVIDLSDGSAAVAVGDVMGKGAPAAVVMGEMRAALRAYAVLDPSPSTVLERLDALVATAPSEQLVTLAYGVVSPDRRSVTFALAGHPPPVVATPAHVRILDEGPGSALGVGAGPWPEATVELAPGQVLLFYSDGLVENRHRDLHAGIAELVTHLDGIAPRRRQPRDLCARLAHLMRDDHTDDDVTLLAVAASPSDATRRASLRLPGDSLAPRVARGFVRDTLRAWKVEEETLEAAELCVSELVTNAVIHTGTATELVAQLDDEFLTVLVRDGGVDGAVEQPPVPDDPLIVSGRGLSLVDAMATAWAAEHGADGTTVWFEIERRREPADPGPVRQPST